MNPDDKWAVRFFCDGKDQMFYESELGTTGYNMTTISLNEEGFKDMTNEICYSLNEMIDSNYNIKKMWIRALLISKENKSTADENF